MKREDREWAIKYGTEWLKDEYLYARDGAFIEIALESLKQEPCDDAISRQASIDFINNHLPFRASNEIYDAYADCVRMLGDNKALPPVNPHPKTGYWIGVDGKPSHLKDGMTTESVWCSECGKWLTASDEYSCSGIFCPSCGTKML